MANELVRWEGETLVASLVPERSFWRTLGGSMLLLSGIAVLVVGLVATPTAGACAALPAFLAAFPTAIGVSILREWGQGTQVEVTERTVTLREGLGRAQVIDAATILAVAVMRHPVAALRIETDRKEWILPASNFSEAELHGLVEEIRKLQHAHRDSLADAQQADRLHADQIRKITSRSETR